MSAVTRAATLTWGWGLATFRVKGFPIFSISILLGFGFLAIFADVISPHSPEIGTLGLRFKPPAWQQGGSMTFLLGTDHLGRDVLSRLIFGTRITVMVGFCAVVVAGVLGTLFGIISGYLGGWADQVIMRITDTWLALPPLTFAIFLAAIVGPSEWNIVIILGLSFWTRYARVIRSEVLSLKEREFVRLAIVAGLAKKTIMWKHIVTEAALSFLGVGVPPPKPAWGLMLADGKKGLMAGYWWLTVLPGCCIMFMVLSANLLGDWLRVKLDPQLRQL